MNATLKIDGRCCRVERISLPAIPAGAAPSAPAGDITLRLSFHLDLENRIRLRVYAMMLLAAAGDLRDDA